MDFLDWASLIIGSGLVLSGMIAIWKRKARTPEEYEGERAVWLGWLWIGLGALFILAVMFDIGCLKALFKLFLEAAN